MRYALRCMQAVFLIMELCEEGSLHDVLTKAGPFGEASVKLIVKRLASAVGHLHKQGKFMFQKPNHSLCIVFTLGISII